MYFSGFFFDINIRFDFGSVAFVTMHRKENEQKAVQRRSVKVRYDVPMSGGLY